MSGAPRAAVIVVAVGWFTAALSELPFVAIELIDKRTLSRPLSMGALIAFAIACAALTVGWSWLGLSRRGAGQVARVAAMIAAAASALEALALVLVLLRVPISFSSFPRWSLLAFGCLSLVATFAWAWRRGVALLVVFATLGVMTAIVVSVLNATGALKTFGLAGWHIYLAARILAPTLLGFAALTISRGNKGAPPVAHRPGLYDPEMAVVPSPGAAGPIDLERYASVLPLAYAFTVIELVFVLGLLAGVVWVPIAVLAELLCLATWASSACKNCRALGALQTRFSPGRAFLTMLVPVLQILLGPYTFQELWRRGYGAGYTPPSRFITPSFVMLGCGLMCGTAAGMLSDARIHSAAAIGSLQTVGCLIYIVGIVMRLVAIFRISERQADALRRLSVIHGLAPR